MTGSWIVEDIKVEDVFDQPWRTFAYGSCKLQPGCGSLGNEPGRETLFDVIMARGYGADGGLLNSLAKILRWLEVREGVVRCEVI